MYLGYISDISYRYLITHAFQKSTIKTRGYLYKVIRKGVQSTEMSILLSYAQQARKCSSSGSCHRRCFLKKGVLKNLDFCYFIKKKLQHRCFPLNIVQFLKTYVLKNICERLLLQYTVESPKEKQTIVFEISKDI